MLTSEPKNSAAPLRYALLNLKIDTTNPRSSLKLRGDFQSARAQIKMHMQGSNSYVLRHILTHTHTWHDMQHNHPIPTPSSMSPRSNSHLVRMMQGNHQRPSAPTCQGRWLPIVTINGGTWGPYKVALYMGNWGYFTPANGHLHGYSFRVTPCKP